MWTDGSQNRATNFALNSGLEGDQCCVKAGKRGWRGEECSALLHGVCQYQVQNYLSAPQHMVAEPGLGALTVRWSHGDDGWVPSSTTVTCCYVKPVEEDLFETKSHKCVDKSVESDTYQVLVDGLETFSEYDITVEAWLDFFNISKTSEFVGRTCKFLLTLRNVTKSIPLQYLKKMSDGVFPWMENLALLGCLECLSMRRTLLWDCCGL